MQIKQRGVIQNAQDNLRNLLEIIFISWIRLQFLFHWTQIIRLTDPVIVVNQAWSGFLGRLIIR